MEVQVHSSTMIAQGDLLSTPPTEKPHTIFDRFASYIHIAVIFAFTPPTPPNPTIINGLLKTLIQFPALTGRMAKTADRHLPCLLIGDPEGGVLLVEATVASKLSDHLPLEPSPDLELLHLPTKGATHVFQVQLNRFQCGGLIVGITAHHRVADGKSMSDFFVAWGKNVRGVPIDQPPVYDQSWLKPRCPPRCEFEHWGCEFTPLQRDGFTMRHTEVEPQKITNILLHYSKDFINEQLKARVAQKYSSFMVLLGHLWRKISIARELDDEECTMVTVLVNGRPRLRPPVPNEFFGNLVLNAYPRAKVKELVSGGMEGAAKIVHEAVSRIGDDYFKSFIDFGAIYEEEDLVPLYEEDGNVLSPNMEVDSWLGLRFEEVNFGGGGELCAFLPTWVPIDGLVIFLTPLQPGGGIDVVVCLLEEHARKLQEISHTL